MRLYEDTTRHCLDPGKHGRAWQILIWQQTWEQQFVRRQRGHCDETAPYPASVSKCLQGDEEEPCAEGPPATVRRGSRPEDDDGDDDDRVASHDNLPRRPREEAVSMAALFFFS